MKFSERLFKAENEYEKLQDELWEKVEKIIPNAYHYEHDYYDSSLELFLTDGTPKITEDQARKIFDDFGFSCIFENQGEEGRLVSNYQNNISFSECSPHKMDWDLAEDHHKIKIRLEKREEELNKIKETLKDAFGGRTKIESI